MSKILSDDFPSLKATIVSLIEEVGLDVNYNTNEGKEIMDLLINAFNDFSKPVVKTALMLKDKFHLNRVNASVMKEALDVHGKGSFLGYSSEKPLEYEDIGVIEGMKVEVPKDEMVSFSDIIRKPLPGFPSYMVYDHFWLAVEGEKVRSSHVLNDIHPEFIVATKVGSVPQEVVMSDRAIVTQRTGYDMSRYLSNMFVEIVKTGRISREYDADIQLILPHIIGFLTNTPFDLQALKKKINIAYSIFLNDCICLDHFLDEIINLTLSGLLLPNYNVESFDIRNFSAHFIEEIIRKYEAKFPSLRKRIVNYLMEDFFVGGNLVSKPGDIIGLSVIGPDVLRDILLPALPDYIRNIGRRFYNYGLKSVLVNVCGICYAQDVKKAKEETGSSTLPKDVAIKYNNLIPHLGTDLMLHSEY